MKRRERRRIDNKEFLALLVEYGELTEQHPGATIPDTLGRMIDDLIYNIETSGKFNKYTYRSELRSEARKNCFAAIFQKKYSLKRDNPFAYFTTIVMNSFYKIISDEKKQSAIKNALYEEVQICHPNSRFEEQNTIKADIYKGKEPDHSGWTPLKITSSNGDVIEFETEETWRKYVDKNRKAKERKEAREKEKEAKK